LKPPMNRTVCLVSTADTFRELRVKLASVLCSIGISYWACQREESSTGFALSSLSTLLKQSLLKQTAIFSWLWTLEQAAWHLQWEVGSTPRLATCWFAVRTSLEAHNRSSCPRSADTALKPFRLLVQVLRKLPSLL